MRRGRLVSMTHPNGSSVHLPRLVPSFSSKGFGFVRDEDTNEILSEVSNALALTGPFINDAILVSAYDLHFKYLASAETHYENKELVIIDSGGYELVSEFDLTEPKAPHHEPRDGFGADEYRAVLATLPQSAPIMIANFDFGTIGNTLEDQVTSAVDLFEAHRGFLHNFVIKPTGKANYLKLESVFAQLPALRRFHVIGVTEKELGRNLHERMKAIAELRLALDRADMALPIHVWGGLDPVITVLYFIAGADMFDGVSWLRYGYAEDAAIPRESYHAIKLGVGAQWRRAEAIRLSNNLSYLDQMTTRMRRFRDTGCADFTIFGRYASEFQEAFGVLKSAVPDWNGGL
jgi:hypothetical protein